MMAIIANPMKKPLAYSLTLHLAIMLLLTVSLLFPNKETEATPHAVTVDIVALAPTTNLPNVTPSQKPEEKPSPPKTAKKKDRPKAPPKTEIAKAAEPIPAKAVKPDAKKLTVPDKMAKKSEKEPVKDTVAASQKAVPDIPGLIPTEKPDAPPPPVVNLEENNQYDDIFDNLDQSLASIESQSDQPYDPVRVLTQNEINTVSLIIEKQMGEEWRVDGGNIDFDLIQVVAFIQINDDCTINNHKVLDITGAVNSRIQKVAKMKAVNALRMTGKLQGLSYDECRFIKQNGGIEFTFQKKEGVYTGQRHNG